MKQPYLKLILIVLLLCIPAACSAVVIQPGADGDGYSWSPDGLTVTITGSSKEYTLSNAISESITVVVDADEVTLNGNNVPIAGIAGNPTLDLENVYINGGTNGGVFIRSKNQRYGISECRNIKNSSIVIEKNVERGYPLSGIGELYGNLDDSTSITVTSNSYTYGVQTVYGVISGGEFMVTTTAETEGGTMTYGVETAYGVISGGEFTVTSLSRYGYITCGVRYVENGGVISGGEFTVTYILNSR